MDKIDMYTYKILTHIVKLGQGDTLCSPWYRDKHPIGVRCGLSFWVQIDGGDDIHPRCHDQITIKEYLNIVETEKDFQDWYDMFIK